MVGEAVAVPASRKLGHYRILERIGSCGMGEVCRARDERLDREVAVKGIRAKPTSSRPTRPARKALELDFELTEAARFAWLAADFSGLATAMRKVEQHTLRKPKP